MDWRGGEARDAAPTLGGVEFVLRRVNAALPDTAAYSQGRDDMRARARMPYRVGHNLHALTWHWVTEVGRVFALLAEATVRQRFGLVR